MKHDPPRYQEIERGWSHVSHLVPLMSPCPRNLQSVTRTIDVTLLRRLKDAFHNILMDTGGDVRYIAKRCGEED